MRSTTIGGGIPTMPPPCKMRESPSSLVNHERARDVVHKGTRLNARSAGGRT